MYLIAREAGKSESLINTVTCFLYLVYLHLDIGQTVVTNHLYFGLSDVTWDTVC